MNLAKNFPEQPAQDQRLSRFVRRWFRPSPTPAAGWGSGVANLALRREAGRAYQLGALLLSLLIAFGGASRYFLPGTAHRTYYTRAHAAPRHHTARPGSAVSGAVTPPPARATTNSRRPLRPATPAPRPTTGRAAR